jgi:hypothetical protein
MTSIRVRLNPVEVEICELIAAARYNVNRRAGVTDGKIGPQSVDVTDLDGIGAEFAAAKALNLYPDFSVSPRSGGVELISRTMARLDVKQTRYPNGRLLVTHNTRPTDADVYILAVGAMPEFSIIGWCYSAQALSPGNVRDLGYGATYAIEQRELAGFSPDKIFNCLLDETREPRR